MEIITLTEKHSMLPDEGTGAPGVQVSCEVQDLDHTQCEYFTEYTEFTTTSPGVGGVVEGNTYSILFYPISIFIFPFLSSSGDSCSVCLLATSKELL